jgi:hypothetical protein
MTKVEELRAKLNNVLDPALKFGNVKDVMAVDPILNALLVAKYAEGVAEGAMVGVSKERRRLKAARDREGTRSINGVRHYLIPVRAFSVPIDSLLAPTKGGKP